MRNQFKKIITLFTAGAMAVSALSLAACGGNFTPPRGIPDGEIKSNGGFIVEKGDYYYFINGNEEYTADNTYGTPVKGSLQRIAKSGLKNNEAETVIPSLMVAADYQSGIYIYGDRVYYASPNNIKNTSGDIEQDYLDFKSAKLDGTDLKSYKNVSSNSTEYRFVEVEGKVYLLYIQDNEVHSYNTSDKKDTLLAKNVESYAFDRTNKENPYLYFTMKVTMDIDVVDGSKERDYNQIYRVRADQTECPYETLKNYEWNKEYLDENDGEIPYVNYGTVVLDGIGSVYCESPTIFSHDLENATPSTASGYTYTLQTYENGGLYFKREDLTKTGTVGEAGWLYYLSEDKLANGWNSVSGNSNSNLSIVARPTEAGNATASALYYLKDGVHHYVYLNGNDIFRADVGADGAVAITRIAQNSSAPTLVRLDTSAADYQYVYYTISGSAGNNVYRAVINGTEADYRTLGYEANEPYRPVQVLGIEHAKSWYDFEMLNGLLFFADAEALGSNSYNYISYVDLTNNGAVMNNTQLRQYKEKFEETTGKDGYLAKLNNDDKTNLSTALKYYFYTGETQQFFDNIEEAEKETGKKDTLYAAEEVEEFKTYTSAGNQLRSDYIRRIGKLSAEDEEAIKEYWRLTLQHYTAPTEEETPLPSWVWAIIGIAIGVVVIGAAACVYIVLKKRGEEETETEEKMFVDTTDDKSVDVYSDMPAESPSEGSEEKANEDAADENPPAEDGSADEEAADENSAETSTEDAPAEETEPETENSLHDDSEN